MGLVVPQQGKLMKMLCKQASSVKQKTPVGGQALNQKSLPH